jgi:hypothetical protein
MYPAPGAFPHKSGGDVNDPNATWLCNAAPDCDGDAVLQWAHLVADQADRDAIAALSPDWATLIIGDTVPVLACVDHQDLAGVDPPPSE